LEGFFPRFGMLFQAKSGSPDCEATAGKAFFYGHHFEMH
jgi:hypothetical protein